MCHLLALELLNQVPQAPLLVLQPLTLPHHTLQLLPQVADEVLKHRFQVSPGCWEHILLQQLPLGGQHLVLLLQQPHLGKEEMGESGSCPRVSALPKGRSENQIRIANGQVLLSQGVEWDQHLL